MAESVSEASLDFTFWGKVFTPPSEGGTQELKPEACETRRKIRKAFPQPVVCVGKAI